MSLEPLFVALSLAPVATLLIPAYYALIAGVAGAATAPRPIPRGRLTEGLSAIVCFVSEGTRLEVTVRAYLAAAGDFPRELLLVGDAPSPETLELAARLATEDPRVRLVGSGRRRGKAVCQAEGVAAARYPRLLFLDARTRIERHAPERLALPLDEAGVCYTTGRLLYEGDEGAEQGYWHLEHWIRRHEDANGGPLGASGGLLACRRADYVACPAEAMLDLVIPCVMERLTGGRGRYVESAVAYEPAREGLAAWRRARVRIQARATGSTGMLRGWLAGAGWGRAGTYLAHKLLRWTMAPSLVLVLGLWHLGPPPAARLAGWGAALLFLSLLVATCSPGGGRLSVLAAPGYAFSTQLRGWLRALRGDIPRYWAP